MTVTVLFAIGVHRALRLFFIIKKTLSDVQFKKSLEKVPIHENE